MTLWVVLVLMVAAALAVVMFPQLRKRRRAAASRRDYDVAVYADQLREIKTDVERGVLSADEETQARLEIERRVLDADASRTIMGKQTGSPIFSAIGASLVLAFIPGFALGLYLWRGSPELPGQSAEMSPAAAAAPAQVPEVGVSVEELAARLREQPDNLDGWLLLGRSYITLGRHSEAVRAYRQAVGLAPGDASVQSRLGESMVMATEGFVTPAAREIFEAALGIEPRDLAALYYLALAAAQAGRLQEAFDGWRTLAREAPADAPWLGDVRERLVGLAGELGLDADEALAGVPAGPAPARTAAPGAKPGRHRRRRRNDTRGPPGDDPQHGRAACRTARGQPKRRGRLVAPRPVLRSLGRARQGGRGPRPGPDGKRGAAGRAARTEPRGHRRRRRNGSRGPPGDDPRHGRAACRTARGQPKRTRKAGCASPSPTKSWASATRRSRPAPGPRRQARRSRPRRADRAKRTSPPPPKWLPRTARR